MMLLMHSRAVILATVSAILLLTPLKNHASENSGLYGPVAVEHYLTGNYTASRHPHFVRLEKSQLSGAWSHFYLRKKAAQDLSKLISAFRKEHPDIRIWVASAHRRFHRQRSIWEAKWSGRRKVDGQKLNEFLLDPTARAKKILEYSAMPGTSRHHWGTEVDFNHLRNSYYENGSGLIIYTWLKKNAATYGFCQPYTAGRTQGHREEKWHWSYRPLAAKFQRKWEQLFSENTSLYIQSIVVC